MLFSIKEKAMNQDSKSKVAFLVYAILVVDNMLLTVVGKFKHIAVNCEFFFLQMKSTLCTYYLCSTDNSNFPIQ